MLALDATTRSEYDAETTAADAAQAVVDALADPVTVRIYDGAGNVKASGTMGTPWATQAAGVVTIGEVSSFAITAAGAPDPTWYLRFESGARWLRGSFGLRGQAGDFVLSSDSWINGYTIRLGTVVVNAPSNTAPSLVGAPTSLNFLQGTGGSYNFGAHAVDAEGDTLTFSLVGSSYTGIGIDPATGLLTVSTIAAAAERTLIIRVSDPGGLSSDWTCATTIASTGTFKWNPGHYAETQTYTAIPDSVVTGSTGISTLTAVKGVVQRYNWSSLEPTRGNYNFALINADLARLRPYGKRLIPLIMDRSWSGTSASSLPAYLASESGGSGGWTVKLPSGGVIANIWLAPIMDRLIALSAAMAAEYDDEPLFEGIRFEEITPGYTAGPGYSYAAMITQWKRLATACRSQWASTNVFFNTNTLGGVTGPLQIIEHGYPLGVSAGGPDVIPPPAYNTPPGEGGGDYQIAGDRAYTQNPDLAKGDNPALFLRDYRTLIPCMNSVQTPSLGGKEGTFYPADLAQYACTDMRVTHMSWVVAPSNVTVNWAAHIRPYLAGSPLATLQTFPSSLTTLGKSPITGGT